MAGEMGRLREFKRKLDEIQRSRSAGTGAARKLPGPEEDLPAPPSSPAPRWGPYLQSVLTRASAMRAPAPPAEPIPLTAACPGVLTEVSGAGTAYLIEGGAEGWEEPAASLREAICRPRSPLRERLLRGARVEEARAEDLLFLDIETTGLGSTPLFLIGTMAFGREGFAVRQYLARDYTEERAVLLLFLDALQDRQLLVSFNGKSFDLPYIKVRLSYHRVAYPAELPHFDLLHEARRIWRGSLPNCRLQTLEQMICGRGREGDIDGAQIPEAYHRFVRSGDAAEIARIVQHNRLDLLTMADLMLRMPPPSAG